MPVPYCLDYCSFVVYSEVREPDSSSSVFFFLIFFFLFHLFLAALGLHCCAQAFSSYRERGLLFIVVRGLLICGGGARALGARASVVAARGLVGSRAQAQ